MGVGNLNKKTITMDYNQKRQTILHWDHQRAKVDQKYTLTQLAEWAQKEFSLPKYPAKNTLSDLITKHRDRFLTLAPQDEHIRRARAVTCPQVEEALVLWVLQKQHQKRNLNRELIKTKGRIFLREFGLPETTLRFSDHWMDQFEKRNAFRMQRSHGESGSADISSPEVQARIVEIRHELAKYPICDRYNMDETGLFYNMSPNTTIAREPIEGRKKDKTRITIAFTCNADGTDRFRPMFIGRAAKPRCFNRRTGKELGFFYFNNAKAWMTGILFQQYLKQFDHYVGRPVILLLDNAPSHVWTDLTLQNVKILSLPPNTTSKLQPLDAGIIAAFKRHYRRRQIEWGLDQLDDGRNPYGITQLQAMRWVQGAWNSLDQSVFANCWRHTGFTDENTPEEPFTLPVDTDFVQEYQQFIQQANITNPMTIENFLDPVKEDEDTQVELSDEEIVDLVKESYSESTSEDQPEEVVTMPSPYLSLPIKAQICVFAQAIALIEDSSSGWWGDEKEQTIENLRRMQRDCRRNLWEEERAKFVQTSIIDY